jgi:hypothetical protein
LTSWDVFKACAAFKRPWRWLTVVPIHGRCCLSEPLIEKSLRGIDGNRVTTESTHPATNMWKRPCVPNHSTQLKPKGTMTKAFIRLLLLAGIMAVGIGRPLQAQHFFEAPCYSCFGLSGFGPACMQGESTGGWDCIQEGDNPSNRSCDASGSPGCSTLLLLAFSADGSATVAGEQVPRSAVWSASLITAPWSQGDLLISRRTPAILLFVSDQERGCYGVVNGRAYSPVKGAKLRADVQKIVI